MLRLYSSASGQHRKMLKHFAIKTPNFSIFHLFDYLTISVSQITVFLINFDFRVNYTYICKNFWKEAHGPQLHYS